MNSNQNLNQNPKKRKKWRPFRHFLFDFTKITGAISVLLWLRPKFLYESKAAKKHVKGKAVVVANHSSFIDPIALLVALWYRRMYFIATSDLFNTKLKNFFFRGVHAIPIDRNNLNMNVFRECFDVLEEGKALGIFPEGGLNREASLNDFKSGAVLIAFKSKSPIVPIYIVPPKKWYNRTVIVMGEKMEPFSGENVVPNLGKIDEVSRTLKEKENALLEIYNQWKTKKSSK